MDEFSAELSDNPELKAGLISKLFFCYLNPLLRFGYKNKIEKRHVPRVLKHDESEALTNALEKGWERELMEAKLRGRKPSLFRAMLKLHGYRYLLWGLVPFFQGVLVMWTSIMMGGLIAENTEKAVAYGYATGVAVTAILARIAIPYYLHNVTAIGIQLKVALSALIFKKTLSLRSDGMRRTSVGRIVNLLSNDLGGFNFWFQFLNLVWIAPLHIIIGAVYFYRLVGWAALSGLLVLCSLIPCQAFFSKRIGKYKKMTSDLAEKRVGLVSEIIHGIRVIKMYAWESAFSSQVHEARKAELRIVRKSGLCHGAVASIFFPSYHLIILAMVVTMSFFRVPITPGRIFVAGTLFIFFRMSITALLPKAIQHLSHIRVTLSKIQAFLLLPHESVDAESQSANSKEKRSGTQSGGWVEMTNCDTKWNIDDSENCLENITLTARPGTLTIVVGPVGSGKSSLLCTMLGEMVKDSGSLEVNGSIGYVPQEAWIFSASLRQNILFGAKMNSETYRATLRACALKKDLELMPDGDRTLVGDKGVALSGGQKARVNLARAVYRDADIYLLDDPLSAVDASVSNYLFKRCIMGRLKGKTRILVTHQLQYLKYADNVVVLKGGLCVGSGRLKELRKEQALLSSIFQEVRSGRGKSEGSSRGNTSTDEDAGDSDSPYPVLLSKAGPETPLLAERPLRPAEEGSSVASVSWGAYYHFLANSVCHPTALLPLLGFVLSVQLLYTTCDWWIKTWCTAALEFQSGASATTATIFGLSLEALDRGAFLEVYLFLVLGLILLSLIRGLVFRNALSNSAQRLHRNMFRSVLESPVRFFEAVPAGRILNRFANDVGIMDEQLGNAFLDVFQDSLLFLFAVAVVCVLNPLLLIPTIPLIFLVLFLRHYYIRTCCQLKRLESNARSPILSHLSATLNGLVTVRAFKAEEEILHNFYQHLDYYTAAHNIYFATTRWFGVILDWSGIVFISIVAFGNVALPTGDVDPASMGLALNNCILVIWMFQYLMHQSVELETGMVSVERILEYTRLEPETPLESSRTNKPPPDWPSKGEIAMADVSLKYAPNSPNVLSGISLRIRPSEKIGIVGRTGSGKSSLFNTVFRTAIVEGIVTIDGVDTSKIGLRDLRGRLSIIPQDPVLFSGSLRQNLDPFNRFRDDVLWEALEQVQLKESVMGLGRGLESEMEAGGNNFSVGQRQLLSLARCLLQKAKVLVIDEATANVDPVTDAIIQETLRTCFRNSTVLCIAHRLHTIVDSDRVMVLSEGKVIEFDAPHLLLQMDSVFRALIEETGADSMQGLVDKAEAAYMRNQAKVLEPAVMDDLFSKVSKS